MKHVVSNHEVPHLWAHQSQPDAKNAGGSFYFNGDTIYSYGSHFPIARHARDAAGLHVVLVTTRTYGVTTQRHVSRTRQAIPSSLKEWDVVNPQDSPAASFEHFQLEHRQLLDEVGTAKNKVSRAKRYQKLASRTEYANEFAAAFGLAARLQLPTIAGVQETLAEIEATEIRARQTRERKAKLDAKKRELAARFRYAEAAVQWRAGESVNGSEYYFPDTLLRIEGDEIATSRGARFPIAHAYRVIRLIERMRASGATYQRNGHTIHLGHYPLDSIDASGNVRAGCHYVLYSEISRIAALLPVERNSPAGLDQLEIS